MRITVVTALAVAALVAVAALNRPAPAIFGFTRDGAKAADRARTAVPASARRADRIRDEHRVFAGEPHIAGSRSRSRAGAWHARSVHRARPRARRGHDPRSAAAVARGSRRRDDVAVRLARVDARGSDPGDPYTQIPPEKAGLPYHAYSASGEVTAPVVYAGSGNPSDYDALAAARHRHPRQDRARPLLGAVQLSRLQGADGAAARRRRRS